LEHFTLPRGQHRLAKIVAFTLSLLHRLPKFLALMSRLR
jgi:hypothetical protein